MSQRLPDYDAYRTREKAAQECRCGVSALDALDEKMRREHPVEYRAALRAYRQQQRDSK